MMRVRLKADGRIVEILPDGTEKTIDHSDPSQFVRQVRRRCGLTQAAFAEKIEVPIETVRNWEQGKRHPRAQRAHAGRVRRAHRGSTRDRAQLGAGQALAARPRPRAAQADRQGARRGVRDLAYRRRRGGRRSAGEIGVARMEP